MSGGREEREKGMENLRERERESKKRVCEFKGKEHERRQKRNGKSMEY